MEKFYERIAEKCLLKYKQISKRRRTNDKQWSPLAAVVQHTLPDGPRETSTQAVPINSQTPHKGQLHLGIY